MTETSCTGRRKATRLIRVGLPGAVALLVLVATIAVSAASRPAAAARRGDNWVTSWSASPQRAVPSTLAAAGFDNQTRPRHHLHQRRRQSDPARADERLRHLAAARSAT